MVFLKKRHKTFYLHIKKNLKFIFSSGGGFPLEEHPEVRLVVHCGGCMLTRREVLRRIAICREKNVPIVNYGICLFRCLVPDAFAGDGK